MSPDTRGIVSTVYGPLRSLRIPVTVCLFLYTPLPFSFTPYSYVGCHTDPSVRRLPLLLVSVRGKGTHGVPT